MSLVAYAESSDDDSDSDNETGVENQITPTNNHTSNEDDLNFLTRDISINTISKKTNLNLPAPSKCIEKSELDIDNENISECLSKLPMPKTKLETKIIEDDDEFLHKKEIPERPSAIKCPVKITIPSLAQFKNLDDVEKNKKTKPSNSTLKSFGLLNLLPKPKNEQFFSTSKISIDNNQSKMRSVTSLIPDSVKNRSLNLKTSKSKLPTKSTGKQNMLVNVSESDSDDDDDDGKNKSADFFSLNTPEELPEVSTSEINAMVAKRAAKMAEASTKINNMLVNKNQEITIEEQPNYSTKDCHQKRIEFDEKAIQNLVGSQAKRRKITENIQVTELTSAQVLPNKGEWLRSALALETTYQPKGVLVDEEPAPGTRKKHQITYLAHQAKANEAELQAMWAANRHTRRATASKYGF